jgi:HEPN domain-containing protein
MPPDKPEILLRKARQDELILEKLLADQEIDDDMLGFHAQQAAEKMLKAVLASRAVDYPKTHNLRILIELLASDGILVPDAISEVTRLTPFGTTFRYDHFPPATHGERARWLESIRRLRAFVETLLR